MFEGVSICYILSLFEVGILQVRTSVKEQIEDIVTTDQAARHSRDA